MSLPIQSAVQKTLESTLSIAIENLKLSQYERSQILFMARVVQNLVPKEDVILLVSDEWRQTYLQKIYPQLYGESRTFRNRALIFTFHLVGIRNSLIAEFLGYSSQTVQKLVRRLEIGDHGRLFSPETRAKKYERQDLKELLFEVLHTPPQAFGINRTTWTIDLLHDVILSKGELIGKNYICRMIKNEGYVFRKTKEVLTSNDPNYEEKLRAITRTLRRLGPADRFFSIDEYGPVSVRQRGGRRRVRRGEKPTVPQYQDSKGHLIVTAALEMSSNQITHFYSERKDTDEMIKLLHVLSEQYGDCGRLYLSWDAASWHSSRRFLAEVKRVNSQKYRNEHQTPRIKLRPLPARAQFLNVIESVFSGMSRAIIDNSNYQSVDEAKAAIDRYFEERNGYFRVNPRKAGNKIWGQEQTPSYFSVSNNCKDPRFTRLTALR